MDYKFIASKIIESVGGKENVLSVAHCATRLRFVLNDYNKRNETELENIETVKGTHMCNIHCSDGGSVSNNYWIWYC